MSYSENTALSVDIPTLIPAHCSFTYQEQPHMRPAPQEKDTKKTLKSHRKDTEKTLKKHKKKQEIKVQYNYLLFPS